MRQLWFVWRCQWNLHLQCGIHWATVASLYPTEFLISTTVMAVSLALLAVSSVIFWLEHVWLRREHAINLNTVGLVLVCIGCIFATCFWAINPWGHRFPVSFSAFVMIGLLPILEVCNNWISVFVFLLSPLLTLLGSTQQQTGFFALTLALNVAAALVIAVERSGEFRWGHPIVVGVMSAMVGVFAISILFGVLSFTTNRIFRVLHFVLMGGGW